MSQSYNRVVSVVRCSPVQQISMSSSFSHSPEYQCSPLHISVSFGQATNEPLPILEALLLTNPDLEAKDSYGNTPLHIAAAFCNITGVRRLIEAGADPRAVNDKGKTPLDLAKESHSPPGVYHLLMRLKRD